MKHKILFVSFLIISICVSSLNATITFEKWYGSGSGYGYSVQQTMDGGYIISGHKGDHLLIMKTDSKGDTIWRKVYGNTGEDVGYSVIQTVDSGYVITGWITPPSDERDIILLKTNNYGDSLWAQIYGGTYSEYGRSVINVNDSSFMIIGCTWSFGSGQYDVYMIRTNSMGDTLWTRVKGGGGWDTGWSIQRTIDGGYILTGETNSYGPGSYNVYLVKTDSLGSTLWQKALGGNGVDYGRSVKQTPDGGYIVAGYTYSFGAGKDDMYLIKTDSYGDTIWTRTYGGYDEDYAYSVEVCNNNGCIVVGHTKSFGIGGFDVYLVRIDSLGNMMWQKTFGSNVDEYAYDIKRTSDGGYVIVGWREAGVLLIKTDSLGNISIKENPVIKEIPTGRIIVLPNPFTTSLRVRGISNVRVFDITGRPIVNFRDHWNGKDSHGHLVPPGIYFLKVDGNHVGKVVKVR